MNNDLSKNAIKIIIDQFNGAALIIFKPIKLLFSITGLVSILLIINIIFFGYHFLDTIGYTFKITQREDYRISSIQETTETTRGIVAELNGKLTALGTAVAGFEHRSDEISCLRAAGAALEQKGYIDSHLEAKSRFGDITVNSGLKYRSTVYCLGNVVAVYAAGVEEATSENLVRDLVDALSTELIGQAPPVSRSTKDKLIVPDGPTND